MKMESLDGGMVEGWSRDKIVIEFTVEGGPEGEEREME